MSKFDSEAIGVKDANAAIDVGREEVKMILAVIVGPPGHILSLASVAGGDDIKCDVVATLAILSRAWKVD